MKKITLLIALSVLLYSAPGHAMPGEEAEAAKAAKAARAAAKAARAAAAAEEHLELKFTRARDLMPALREMTKKDSDQEEECQLRETLDLLLGDIQALSQDLEGERQDTAIARAVELLREYEEITQKLEKINDFCDNVIKVIGIMNNLEQVIGKDQEEECQLRETLDLLLGDIQAPSQDLEEEWQATAMDISVELIRKYEGITEESFATAL